MTYFNSYIVAILIFCVASSKHIIIYNEELLVTITGFCFVVYIKTAFGNSIKESLDESRNSILQELQSLSLHKKNGSLQLKNIHEKVPLIYQSSSSIENYIYALLSQISNRATATQISSARQQIISRLEKSPRNLYISYPQKMAEGFLPGLFVSTLLLRKKSSKASSPSVYRLLTAKKALGLLKKSNSK